MAAPSCVALIPARGGSKRVPGKNVRPLAGHPLLAYTIAAARDSGVFGAVVVSTDSPSIADVALHYGAEVPFLRPAEMSGDLSPDIEWVRHTLDALERAGRSWACFSLLRPTSPFRKAETIHRAWRQFGGAQEIDSLRAVEPCRQHPGKMWVVQGERMTPLLAGGPTDPPWHSTPYQALPRVYVQNASLEIAWRRTVTDTASIAGRTVLPFFTEGYEGFDVNEPKDWWYAEHLLNSGEASLPPVSAAPWSAAGLPSH
ncbi:MAG: acylneuraminate cytidylyltransferase family protein [Gemmatimonadales bacterium]|nr:acylneuraminate cytidylyltransferase family protein [Gemmatimonadales bacterium]